MGRVIGWGWWVVGAMVFVVVLGEWVTACGLGLLGVVGLLTALVYVVTVGGILLDDVPDKASSGSDGSPTVWIGVNQEGMELRASEVESVLKWCVFRKLWRFDDVWLLFQDHPLFMLLPVEAINPQMQAYIVKRLTESGAKVV